MNDFLNKKNHLDLGCEEKMKVTRKFWILITLAVLAKVIIAQWLPVYLLGGYIDDAGLLLMGQNIAKGHWLGEYTQYILHKGIGFPLYLALCYILPFSYTVTTTLLYGMTSILFIKAIDRIVKNEKVLFFVFLVVLFCPITTSFDAFQRVYRNSISPIQTLLFFACLIGLYLRREDKLKIYWPWAAGCGLSFSWFWITREDSVWGLPFFVCSLAVTVVSVMLSKQMDKTEKIKKTLLGCTPIACLVVVNLIISAINYNVYGIFTTNELTDSNFAKAYQSILSIQPEEDIDFVSVPASTIRRLSAVSPSFAELAPSLLREDHPWDGQGTGALDGNLEDGWFFWAMRGAAYEKGYGDTATEVNEFWERIYNEVEAAFDAGTFERRAVMPSALMSPWKESYEPSFIKNIYKTVKAITQYEDIEARVQASSYPNDDIHNLFLAVTKDVECPTPKRYLHLSGWVIFKENSEIFEIAVTDSTGNTYPKISRKSSEDVYELYLREYGQAYPDANACRFNIIYPLEENTAIPELSIFQNGRKIGLIPLDQSVMHSITSSTQGFDFFFDILTIEHKSEAEQLTMFEVASIDFWNFIARIYQLIAPVAVALGCVSYIYILGKSIYGVIKDKRLRFLDELLFLTGILLSLFVLSVGISYTHTTAFPAIQYTYLSGSYPLWTVFWTLSIGIACLDLFQKENGGNVK